MAPLIHAALRQEALNANRLHAGTLTFRQRHRLAITLDFPPRPCPPLTPWVRDALAQFGGVPTHLTAQDAARWARFFALLRTGRAGLVHRAVVLDGLGWAFVPTFVVYAPAPTSAPSATAMPMVSFVYVTAPAPADDAELDTATAGHLLALALEQFRLDSRRRRYMPRVVAKYEAENRAVVVDATVSGEYLRHMAERREVLDAFGPYLPGSFVVRTSGWVDCAVDEGRRAVFAALVFPFDLL